VKIVQGIFLVLLAGVLSLAAFVTASAFKWAQGLPDFSTLDTFEYGSTSQIFSQDGQLIGEILPVAGTNRYSTDRIPVTIKQVSPAALEAIVSSEDSDFFHHYGFDTSAIVKAVYEQFFGNQNRGGSTITDQVIKNTVLSEIADERTLERKVKELMLSIQLERRLTKEEILQRYVNLVYWGGNLYGIRAASEAYFHKDPLELNLAEGLYLARLIPAPSANYKDFKATRATMKVVLDRMVAGGTISKAMAERAWRYPLEPTGWQVKYDGKGNVISAKFTPQSLDIRASVSSDLNPEITYAVRNELVQRFGNARVFSSGGLKVYTTIDYQAQEAANQASLHASEVGGIYNSTQLAIIALNPQTGGILAMVGEHMLPGKPLGEFNRALSAERQLGSSFKPIVYATALEQGGFTQASVIVDEPTTFTYANGKVYDPHNFDHKYVGPSTLREMLDQSRNIPAVKLLEAVTPQAVVTRARELGYTNLQPYPSLALGAFVQTPLQHASAMGAFADGGVWVEPHLIKKVEDADGNVLWQAPERKTRVWSPQTAYIMLNMLRGNVIDRGPTALSHRAAIPGRWVGGKTGTSNDDRDLWFVGITPGMVAAVWLGNDDNSPIKVPGGHLVSSSIQPVPIWRYFAEHALQGASSNPDGFPEPSGITFETVNRVTGAPDPKGTRMAFVSGTEPTSQTADYTPLQITIPLDRRTGKRATPQTPRGQVVWKSIDPEDIGQYMPTSASGGTNQ
jgi:membrane peptidoglycan carboxypeptidase